VKHVSKSLIIGLAFLVLVVLPVTFYVMGYIGQTADVVASEIAPSVIQQKYVWFQNQKAAIDNSDANIRGQINSALVKKSDQNRSDWDRTDKEQFGRSVDDVMGVIALRNGLVRDYNSAMSQWQMSFANLGTWPKGDQ
jgi:acetyl-CoA acetyltransferase